MLTLKFEIEVVGIDVSFCAGCPRLISIPRWYSRRAITFFNSRSRELPGQNSASFSGCSGSRLDSWYSMRWVLLGGTCT